MERTATTRLAAWVANAVVLVSIIFAVLSASAPVALAATHPHRGRRVVHVDGRRHLAKSASARRTINAGGRRQVATAASVDVGGRRQVATAASARRRRVAKSASARRRHVAKSASARRTVNAGGRRQVATAASVRRGPATYAELGRVESAQAARPASQPTDATASASSTCANSNLVPTSANIPQIAAATLCVVNQQRVLHGDQPLRDNGDLDSSATEHSQDMVANNYCDHTSPTGSTVLSRILASGFVPSGEVYALGENIALGAGQLATPAAVVQEWMASPGHRENILDSSYMDSGIGVVAQVPAQFAPAQVGATYTQDFGAVESAAGITS